MEGVGFLMSAFKVGDLVRIKDDIIDINIDGYSPGINDMMERMEGSLYYIRTVDKRSDVDKTLYFLEGFSRLYLVDDFCWAEDWLEIVNIRDYLKKGDRIYLAEDRMDKYLDTYPYVTNEMKTLFSKKLSIKGGTIEELYDVEYEGVSYLAIKLEKTAFLWNPILFEKREESEEEDRNPHGLPF